MRFMRREREENGFHRTPDVILYPVVLFLGIASWSAALAALYFLAKLVMLWWLH